MAQEWCPAGAPSETLAESEISLPPEADIGAQLGRLETLLDSILRTLAPLVGAS